MSNSYRTYSRLERCIRRPIYHSTCWFLNDGKCTKIQSNLRLYQTKTGVFGYKPKIRKKYQIPQEVLQKRAETCNFYRLATAYRQHGHLKADINPISITENQEVPELHPKWYNLKISDKCNFDGIISSSVKQGNVQEGIDYLENTYCKNTSAEFMYMDTEEREWFIHHYERIVHEEIPAEDKKALLLEMIKAQTFDQFLATKFVTLKRYGGEGCEPMVGFFMELLKQCGSERVMSMVIGMPHRGRLNLLTGLFQLPPSLAFRKIKGFCEFPSEVKTTGDVLSHLTCSVDIPVGNEYVHVTMLPNPSHLEAINPVSLGKTRAKQMTHAEGDYGDGTSKFGDAVINIQVHGDAAFSGQGVNQETISLSKLPHYEVGGTIHLVVNNQLGFTAPGDRGRSSKYTTDLAKMVSSPVIHVNGDYPEEILKATKLAVKFQRKFREDVFIDLNCYRQWGHNELDDPTFTNPAVYKIINNRKTIPDTYAQTLIKQGIITEKEIEEYTKQYYQLLNKYLKEAEEYEPKPTNLKKQWSGIQPASGNITEWDTGFHTGILRYIGERSVSYPPTFNIHQHLLKTHVTNRISVMRSEPASNVDWSTAESLAIGSLLYQGFNVRISGQDVGRGTFSHRHVMLVDQTNNDMYIPLNNILPTQEGKLEVANSLLSEEAVLGFEYGMSIENPDNLIIWEAQFGDFANGAQIMIDQFITNGEMKWGKCSGLVMLLPHGYEGAGPEHSSCRIERYLQMSDSSETECDSDDVNFNFIYPTTPAQYFHALRRQVIRNFRKPLIVVAPKTLLRLSEATSDLSEFEPNTHFLNVIPDKQARPEDIQRVIFTTGKHYYNLEKERKSSDKKNTAIVRIESLSPFPTRELQEQVSRYPKAKKFVWSQEEHRNMGAWSFINPRFENLVGIKLVYVGNDVLGTPAVGIGAIHRATQEKIIKDSFTV